MEPGAVREPVEREIGYHIIKLKKQRKRSMKIPKGEIKVTIHEQKIKGNTSVWLEELREKAEIESPPIKFIEKGQLMRLTFFL